MKFKVKRRPEPCQNLEKLKTTAIPRPKTNAKMQIPIYNIIYYIINYVFKWMKVFIKPQKPDADLRSQISISVFLNLSPFVLHLFAAENPERKKVTEIVDNLDH